MNEIKALEKARWQDSRKIWKSSLSTNVSRIYVSIIYIYILSNSHRVTTEHWQMTLDTIKDKKDSCITR